MPFRGSLLADVRFIIHASPRTIYLGPQIMGNGPLADAAPSLQSILARESEVNAPVDPTYSGFFRGIHAGGKAAVHSGKKI
jgi:hypothetical protein